MTTSRGRNTVTQLNMYLDTIENGLEASVNSITQFTDYVQTIAADPEWMNEVDEALKAGVSGWVAISDLASALGDLSVSMSGVIQQIGEAL